MREELVFIIIAAIMALGIVFCAAGVPFDSAPPPTIQEDDPRWDCRTMGNRICGPGAPHPAGHY